MSDCNIILDTTYVLPLFGILFFLILIGLLNIIAANIVSSVFQIIVNFVNQNIFIIILISVLILLANIFEGFIFPFNIFYPPFNAIGGILCVEFIFRILRLVSILVQENIYAILVPFYFLAMILVPIIVLIVGYVHVFARLGRRRRKPIQKEKIKIEESDLEWRNVGDEFKSAAYNLATTLKESLDPEKGKKAAKKMTKKIKKKTKKIVKKASKKVAKKKGSKK